MKQPLAKSWIITVCVLPLCMALQGCLAVAIGAGAAGVYYWKASESTYVSDDPVTVLHAAEAVMTAMGWQVDELTSSEIKGRLEATNADRHRVSITAKGVDAEGTDLKVRVGFDERMAAKILNRILLRLDGQAIPRDPLVTDE